MLLCALMIIIAELLYFHKIFSDNKKVVLAKADAVVVFNGSRDRIVAGYELANSGYAPCFIISPSTGEELKRYDKRYRLSSTVTHITEDKARTTFENAALTRKIILENGFRSVILVTSDYHLPRSYFLLRAIFAGHNVRINRLGIPNSSANRYLRGKKIIYNEMVKLWGSLGELLIYKIRGRLPDQNPKDILMIKYIKSLLLFD